jgi:hypothetical protein
MLVHLPILILTSLHLTPIADSVPKYDIAQECRSAGGQEAQKRCVDDETQARGQLQTEWVQFTARAKTQCNEETSVDGTASYVELLTCLEMDRDVSKEGDVKSPSK